MARKWFPLVFSLFVFVLVTNLLGYIPLPVNTTEKIHLGGLSIPSFQIYAADTNVALPLVLALGVFIAYNVEGFRHHGFRGYMKTLVPAGIGGGMLLFLYPLEIVSHFLRLLSLAIRLWANLLAGHLLIDFMAGDMAVLLGLPAMGWFTLPLGVAIYLFECVLIAGLQAFIFAILTAIYLGGAVDQPLTSKGARSYMFHILGIALVFHSLITGCGAGSTTSIGENAGKAIALGVGAGGGAAGAGAGIGMLFGKVIESVTRQPEMRDEITSIQWLGFALTEATFFYGLVGGFIAFFL